MTLSNYFCDSGEDFSKIYSLPKGKKVFLWSDYLKWLYSFDGHCQNNNESTVPQNRLFCHTCMQRPENFF